MAHSQSIEDVRQTARAELAVRCGGRYTTDETLDTDIRMFIDVFAVPLLDACAANEIQRAKTRNAFGEVLRTFSMDLIEDILPDRSLANCLDGLPEDPGYSPDGLLSHENEIGSDIHWEVWEGGIRKPASKRYYINHADHGEWERQLSVASFVRSSNRNRTIREEIDAALSRREVYWIGQWRHPAAASAGEHPQTSVEPTIAGSARLTPSQHIGRGRVKFDSFEKLAEEAGISPRVLTRIRDGHTAKLSTRKAVAVVCGCTAEDLLWPESHGTQESSTQQRPKRKKVTKRP